MSSSICGLKITATDGTSQFINCAHVYYYKMDTPKQASPFILGRLTGVKYGVSNSDFGDVMVVPNYIMGISNTDVMPVMRATLGVLFWGAEFTCLVPWCSCGAVGQKILISGFEAIFQPHFRLPTQCIEA